MDFLRWFRKALEEGEIIDPRYPIKGTYVWLPYGFKLRKFVTSKLRELLDKSGHDEMLFPTLVPKDMFMVEGEHVEGLGEEVYWVTRGGSKELEMPLALRPTSETSIYPMLSLWVRSHSDLPIKIYQIVNVFRYETKQTRPLIRVREVTTFKEAHTAHASAEGAEAQVGEATAIYSNFFDELCIPYLILKRPEWDKFPGAIYTLTFDTIFPDRRSVQIGTVHNLGQNFSKSYDIKYENEEGSWEYAHQTCYGISERMIAAVIAIHGDSTGMILPPDVAPVQVVIVPVDLNDPAIMKTCEKLEKLNFRVRFDRRDMRAGAKYYYWERRGVPIRLEVGPKEVKSGDVTMVRRDEKKRERVSIDGLAGSLKKAMEEMSSDLRRRAWDRMREIIKDGKLEDLMDPGDYIYRVGWCGGEDCGLKMEEKGLKLLGSALNGKKMGCAVCGRGGIESYVGRSY
jgi:prolyl-tRNA synthetase